MKRAIAIIFVSFAALLLVSRYVLAIEVKVESKAPAPSARMGGVAVAAKGKLYFIGGIAKESMSSTGAVDEYDPSRNTWTSKTAMPTSRASAAAVELNDCIYVLGGREGSSVLATVEKYDPAGDSWSACVSMPTARWYLMAAAVNGKIYAFGGIAGIGNARTVLDVVEVYDPTKDSWTSLPAMPTGDSNAGVAAIGEKIYLVGGRLKAGSSSGLSTAKVFVYDVVTGKWDTETSLNQARTGLEACAIGGNIFAIGGASEGTSFSSIEVLGPEAGEWSLVECLQKPRTDHSCVALGDKIYVVGGASAPSPDAIENTLEELSPIGLIPSE
jgi:N-acetylneuraminic acid mutarotase